MTKTTAKALPAMRYLSLFSGFGGLDMAVEQLWPDAVCVAHCENNKADGDRGGDARRWKGTQSMGGRRSNLVDAAMHFKALPTPCTTDANGARNATSERSNPDSAHHGGWTLNDVRHADRWGDYAPAISRWEAVLGRPAPDPTDERGRLSPDFVEWMMGWPDGWSDIDGLSRADRLRGGGNGVVTLQGVAAYPQLIERALTPT